MDIKQVVIWGHKLHTHTHSYIHNAFYRTFKYLGYKTIWLDNSDSDNIINNINFSNTMFITEGQVDKNIPIIADSYYVLHNCNMDKYISLSKKNILIIQVYSKILTKDKSKIDDYIYYEHFDTDTDTDKKYSILYMPWATDLLPDEINYNILNLDKIKTKMEINFIGMQTPEWDKVRLFCRKYNIAYNNIGGFQGNNVNIITNQKLIQQSLIAPAIQTKWQVENGYIPCRIFKNISYGRMGITNNTTVYELFNKEIIYHLDINECLKMAVHFENNPNEYKRHILLPLMYFVRDKHTYINRIKTILECFNKQI